MATGWPEHLRRPGPGPVVESERERPKIPTRRSPRAFSRSRAESDAAGEGSEFRRVESSPYPTVQTSTGRASPTRRESNPASHLASGSTSRRPSCRAVPSGSRWRSRFRPSIANGVTLNGRSRYRAPCRRATEVELRKGSTGAGRPDRQLGLENVSKIPIRDILILVSSSGPPFQPADRAAQGTPPSGARTRRSGSRRAADWKWPG